MIKVEATPNNRICQGDIYKNIEHIEYANQKDGIINISKIIFPLVIVLSQDCDLAQDNTFRYEMPTKPTQDKYLLSVLVAPIYNIEHFYSGDHLVYLGLKMEAFDSNKRSTQNKYLKQNKNPRFHYLEFPDSTPIVPSVIDFKHYFSVDVVYLKNNYNTNFVLKVSTLYREDISQRFASFLSRIGLP